MKPNPTHTLAGNGGVDKPEMSDATHRPGRDVSTSTESAESLIILTPPNTDENPTKPQMARRDPNNPVKLRAEARAAELGKPMAQVCREAGVNRHYLAETPKSESRDQVKLGRVAAALNWTIADLLAVGAEKPAAGPQPIPVSGEGRTIFVDPFNRWSPNDENSQRRVFIAHSSEDDETLMLAIDAAIRLVEAASPDEHVAPRLTAELAVRLFHLTRRLRRFPEEDDLMAMADQLLAALRRNPAGAGSA